METVHVEPGDTWSHQFTCSRCATVAVAGPGDLEADEFKVSGYHFAGNARCERRLYVNCPTCGQLHFLDDTDVAEVPYLLNQQADANYRQRRAVEQA